ncbi:MAG: hypothetical protein DI586_09135 [Micavibrio aeruginosavorus]|uniref:Prepilin-type N-terminal cleavage/methylation domain-containing protein n=1 Tax=Micavibrio aeruginosavorus TaxID=349221 RepID=A0A2W5H9C7_9BACT|nr:MAG: hypothetical protein DI586_09135 [Micavibrio aeruginosavorus]
MKKNGFTLVELSIVMIIIGLLIGGILKGQELITNSKVARTIKDLKSFQSGILIFQDSYNGIPGDIAYATTLVPGCTSANNCANGNGNLKVGVEELDAWHYFQNKSISSENVQFWKHLALADIIGGINPGASVIDWGQTFPAGPFDGGYTVADTVGAGMGSDDTSFAGRIFRVHNCALSCNELEGPNATVLSTTAAASIDRKMDDGSPLTGTIRASGAGAAHVGGADACTDRSGATGTYNEGSTAGEACALYFRVSQ